MLGPCAHDFKTSRPYPFPSIGYKGTEGLSAWGDVSRCFINSFIQQFICPFSKLQYAHLVPEGTSESSLSSEKKADLICKEHQLQPRVWFLTLAINVFICPP